MNDFVFGGGIYRVAWERRKAETSNSCNSSGSARRHDPVDHRATMHVRKSCQHCYIYIYIYGLRTYLRIIVIAK